ncbi:hypothetical protein KIL84_011268 [Mauremys mutica]|uniref:Uncharacterized protein n=1 Tax=Mauremys mutica TaxID=74926 RepID=A0A9D3XDC4_9SAUR|nr:hypothetical protein KIL84_011268 [Mauremys mutica]
MGNISYYIQTFHECNRANRTQNTTVRTFQIHHFGGGRVERKATGEYTLLLPVHIGSGIECHGSKLSGALMPDKSRLEKGPSFFMMHAISIMRMTPDFNAIVEKGDKLHCSH